MNLAFAGDDAEVLDFFLDQGTNGSGCKLRTVVDAFDEAILLTEFHLGSSGFGSPDGAICFLKDNKRVFVFVESKMKRIERTTVTRPGRPSDTQLKSLGQSDLRRGYAYNSSLHGQLELRWRFAQALVGCMNRPDKIVREHPNGVHESILESDVFYWRHRLQMTSTVDKHWRRVGMAGDRESLFGLVNSETRFYLMALTKDEKYPKVLNELKLTNQERNLIPYDEVGKRVFWAPMCKLMGLFEQASFES